MSTKFKCFKCLYILRLSILRKSSSRMPKNFNTQLGIFICIVKTLIQCRIKKYFHKSFNLFYF